jgi:hypothetical protein
MRKLPSQERIRSARQTAMVWVLSRAPYKMTLATEIDYLLLGQIVATWLVRSQRVCLCWKTQRGNPYLGWSNCSFYLPHILVENCHFFADTIWQHPDYWSGEIWVSDWGWLSWRTVTPWRFCGISGPYMEVSWNGGTLKKSSMKKWGVPWNKPSIFRYPHSRKPLCRSDQFRSTDGDGPPFVTRGECCKRSPSIEPDIS